jgi:hypothetical protein
MTDISDLIRQARAALAEPDNSTHRRDLAAILGRAALDPLVTEPARMEAAALAIMLAAQ